MLSLVIYLHKGVECVDLLNLAKYINITLKSCVQKTASHICLCKTYHKPIELYLLYFAALPFFNINNINVSKNYDLVNEKVKKMHIPILSPNCRSENGFDS